MGCVLHVFFFKKFYQSTDFHQYHENNSQFLPLTGLHDSLTLETVTSEVLKKSGGKGTAKHRMNLPVCAVTHLQALCKKV